MTDRRDLTPEQRAALKAEIDKRRRQRLPEHGAKLSLSPADKRLFLSDGTRQTPQSALSPPDLDGIDGRTEV